MRKTDPKNNIWEERYFKLTRLFHWIMYPVTAISFLAIGMTLIRKFGADFFIINYLIDNLAVIAPVVSPIFYYLGKKFINKKMEKK